MKLNISSTNLLKALMDVSKAIPSKSPLPILENFLFVLKDGKLEITASDNELTLRTVVQADASPEEGSIAAPARHMLDLLKEDASWATTHNITMLLLGCVVAFVVALLAMKWFVSFLSKYGFKAFGIYRIIVGGIIIIMLLTGHSLVMVD